SNILDLRSKIAQQLKSNNEKHVALGLFIVFCVFNILNFDPYLFLGGDNARYLILAKALARGYGYRDIYLPDAPFHNHFPFGFPLLLTPIIFLFSEQLIFAKLYVMFFSLGSFWLVYRMTKRYFNTQEWILPMIFFSVSPLIIFYSHYVLSEIPYLFFSFLAIYFLSKYDEKHFNIAVIILTIFSVIFTYYIRTAGIALVVAVGVYFLLKRRIKAFSMIFLPSLLAILLINITTKVNASSYRNEFILKNPYVPEAGYLTISEFFQRIFDNLVLYSFKIFPQVICPTLKNNLALVILGIFLAILIIASILKEFKNITLVSIYFVLYIGVILAWPQTWSNERFLLPILPILFYYITKGARTIAKKPVIILSVITLVYLSGTIASHFQTIPESVKKIKKYLSGDELGGYPDYWFNYFS
ncbi:MAG: glycosyltransferase family 39 protein, partial [candidate division WOR-3 bacterium]|nr:glycosyltransferase family 39 protein [candidate division WOR-3 bacterium]